MYSPQWPEPQASGEAKSIDGETVPFDVFGSGCDTVLLVHGWCCDRRTWAEQIHSLSSRYRVVALDLPGHGRASRTRILWTTDAFVEDTLAVVRTLGPAQWAIVGHSLGGHIAVRSAPLIGSEAVGVIAVDEFRTPEVQMDPTFREGVLSKLTAAWNSEFPPFARSYFFTEMTPPDLADWIVGDMATADPAIAVPAVRDLLVRDEAANLRAAAGLPVVVVNGEPMLANQADLRRLHPDVRLVEFQGAGHFLHLEQPERFNRLLLDDVLPSMFAQGARP